VPIRNLAIDFDSFFASVEQQDRPELRGKPVGVAPVLAETTGLIAVSGEAKKLGLKRGTRVAEARQLCPGIVIVESRPEVYIGYHRRLKTIIESCVPVKKAQSIDELECELTADFAAAPERARQLAIAIKAKIAREAGDFVRCSIGIGPNWFLAKVASDMEKPNGLVVIDDADIPGKLLHLKLTDFCGIGEAMAQRLSAAGITTVAQLYATNATQLRSIWGSVEGARFHAWMNGGRQERAPTEHNTIGHGHVLPPAGRNNVTALAVLHRLLQKAAMRLRHTGHYAGSLSLSVRYGDGTRWSDDRHFNETQDTITLTHVLNTLWADRPRAHQRLAPIEVGIVLGDLLESTAHTGDLFTAETENTRTRLHSAVDTLNKTFGKNSVYFGGAHGATDYAPMRIAFTRIPDPELEEIDRSLNRRLKPVKPPPATTEELA
jgi:DNA polymerase-4